VHGTKLIAFQNTPVPNDAQNVTASTAPSGVAWSSTGPIWR
jgi:hypothetical protein